MRSKVFARGIEKMRTLFNESNPFESVRHLAIDWGSRLWSKIERKKRKGRSGNRKERERDRESSRLRNSKHWVIVVDISTRRDSSTIYDSSLRVSSNGKEKERERFELTFSSEHWFRRLNRFITSSTKDSRIRLSSSCYQYILKREKRERERGDSPNWPLNNRLRISQRLIQ